MISDNESINIALVEDDREDAFLLRRALQRSGIESLLTWNGCPTRWSTWKEIQPTS